MSNISSLGIGSEVLTSDLVDQLVSAEREPVELRLDAEQEFLEAQISAFGEVKSAVSSLASAVSSLSSSTTFATNTASSSDESVVTATASSVAEAGTYQIEVTDTAKAHTLASTSHANLTDVVGEGTLTFNVGTTTYSGATYTGFTQDTSVASQDVVIDSSNNTLVGIRDAVNNADIGVNASIVNDGSGYRLLFTSGETGENNSLEITTSGATGNLTDLEYNLTNQNMTETVQGQDANFIVNGLPMTRESNVITEAIPGVTLTLKGEDAGNVKTLTIEQDLDNLKDKIGGFLESYNELKVLTDSLTSYDPDTEEAGLFLGDSTMRNIASQVNSVLTDVVSGLTGGSFQTLSEVGIYTNQSNGFQLSFDETLFDKKFAQDPDGITALFSTFGESTDTLVSYAGVSDNTQAGTYVVNVTAMATQGSISGDGQLPVDAADFLANPVTIDNNNDEFKISVNGFTSDTISLTQGSYTSGDDLAAEIQAQINADETLSSTANTLSVAYVEDAGGGYFSFTSGKYGGSSSVEFSSIDAFSYTSLGISTSLVGSNGSDVEGTINGVAATGSGTRLIGAAGDASEGLRIDILGGTTGDRGSVTFMRGIADQLNNLLDDYLDSGGTISNKLDALNSELDIVDDQRESLELRLETLESQLSQSFIFNDSLISQLNSTSSYLETQFDILNAQLSGG